jgi:tripartite-type tricarboxylate transporter receptor subunit TctC
MKRNLPFWFVASVFLAAMGLVREPAAAEVWPERTVRITTPFAPGMGSPDAAARTIADSLTKLWKQPIVVENRPGGDTMVGTQAFLETRDSHGLLFTTHSTFTVVPLLRTKVPYDPVKDAKPISLVVEDYLALVAAPMLKGKSVSDFVQFARDNPGKVNFFAAPGSPYLAYLAFQKRAAIDTASVPYNNPVNAISDLSEGRIHVAVMPLASVLGPAQLNKVKLLAVTNSERSPAAPDVPTVSESGYPELTFGGYLGLFGPREMSADLRERIASDVRIVLKEREIQQRLATVGLVARGTTPREFDALMSAQRVKWASIAREHKVEPQ